MANNLYVSAAEPYSGKVLISLGILTNIQRTISRVGFFRPIARSYQPIDGSPAVVDRDIHLMHEVFQLDCPIKDMFGVSSEDAEEMLANNQEELLQERILEAYKKLEEQVDFIVIEGTDFLTATSAVETEFNSALAGNLNAPVLLVVDGSSSDLDTITSKAMIGLDSFRDRGCEILGVVANKVDSTKLDALEGRLSTRLREINVPFCAKIPAEPILATPRMDEVVAQINGKVLFGEKLLANKVQKTLVASGSVETMLPRLNNGVLLVTHVDRHDAILMALVSLMSREAPNIAGVVLSGRHEISPAVSKLLHGLPGPRVPIVSSAANTYETVIKLSKLKPALEPRNMREIEIARQIFDTYVDVDRLLEQIRLSAPSMTTPAMFKYELIRQARRNKMRIVLPEGQDDRILQASDALLRLKAVELTILGEPDDIRNRAGQLGVDLDGAQLINPLDSKWHEAFAKRFQKARAKKGMTIEAAREHVIDSTVFGTLMVASGYADGMVSGATHSTANTIRPAFQVIKTQKGASLVSSVFFMCLADRVLVYGDCAVNPDPDAAQLAEIAIQSADTARAFGIEPIVAMLSYSTGESGQGADVDKVKEAVKIAKKLRPDLILEGPLQYDAAVDVSVAKSKLPNSQVGGHATVFVFPDLNTGNNTYKAVQRSAHAIAVGPVLQGLNKPVNDLSRGCLVEDIVNTVAITAIQAQNANT